MSARFGRAIAPQRRPWNRPKRPRGRATARASLSCSHMAHVRSCRSFVAPCSSFSRLSSTSTSSVMVGRSYVAKSRPETPPDELTIALCVCSCHRICMQQSRRASGAVTDGLRRCSPLPSTPISGTLPRLIARMRIRAHAAPARTLAPRRTRPASSKAPPQKQFPRRVTWHDNSWARVFCMDVQHVAGVCV